MSSVGVPQTSAARRAAISFCTASRVGTSTLPPMCPHFFAEESWSSKCTPAAPASIMSFISSNAFSTPPKPDSASATTGRNQSIESSPSAWWIWSARASAALIPRNRSGALSEGYRLWSGYICPAPLASAATCQPER